MDLIYRILSQPLIYRLATAAFAPGAEARITQEIRRLTSMLPSGEPLLDVGCGPRSWLDRVGLAPIGVDPDPAYVQAYQDLGGVAQLGSAEDIPFPDEQFAGVWSIGVFHHLNDATAHRAISQMLRVCRPGGYVAILDGLLPESALASPIPYAIRRLDRGRHMRTEKDLRTLLGSGADWRHARFRYSATGLEMLSCIRVK